MPQKKNPVVKSGEDMFEKLRWGAINAIMAMLVIYVVYSIAAIFVGQLPATVGSIILGICVFYMAVTSQEFRKWLGSLFQPKGKT
jgi:hypothetical protein